MQRKEGFSKEGVNDICKGCGCDLKNEPHPAISRYDHGNICGQCGIAEASNGDFIRNYEDVGHVDYPINYIGVGK